MKLSDLAWFVIRVAGLILVIQSLPFGLATAFQSAAARREAAFRPHPAGSVADTNVPSVRRDLERVRKAEVAAIENGVKFFFLAGAGLYLLLAGKGVHRLLTRIPDQHHDRGDRAA